MAKMKVGELVSTNSLYDANIAEWQMLMAVYDGIRAIVAGGYICQHEREPDESWKRRKSELYSYDYTKSIIEIFHFYLFKKPPLQKLGRLKDDIFWNMFQEDANLYGDSFQTVMMAVSLFAAIQGHIGILVDKSSKEFKNKKEQIDEKVYPYIATYFPPAILDWKFERDDNNRPFLDMVKLLEEDGRYKIWNKNGWELWQLPEDKEGNPDKTNESAEAELIDSGQNPLDEIPFFWHYNQRSRVPAIGVSDVTEVSRIDLSIIRNLSQIEEIIGFAGFPIMLKPKRDVHPQDMSVQQEDLVSPDAIIEFDPLHPESKPEWMPAEVAAPIEATLEVIASKVMEIYRASNTGGQAATENQAQTKSGAALTIEFQLLNSKIVGKAINLEKTEQKIVELWLKWEKRWDELKEEVSLERQRTFDIENLHADLENALLAKTLIGSKKFNELIQKQTARKVLPSAQEDDIIEIDTEIEELVEIETTKIENIDDADDEDKKIIDGDDEE